MKKGVILIVMLLMVTCFVLYPSMIEDIKAASSETKWVYIFVEPSIYAGIETSLLQYITDLEESGFEIKIYKKSSRSSVRNTMWDFYRGTKKYPSLGDVVGCVLVGDIEAAWFEENVDDNPQDWFPTDLYFMDLDGFWVDTDYDGAYDDHVEPELWVGDVDPDIWVGRIKADNIVGYHMNETELLNKYFEKIHSYRTGALTLPKRALLYLDDDGVGLLNPPYEEDEGMEQVYDEITLVKDPLTTTDADYKNRLMTGPGYEFVYEFSHGGWDGHGFFPPGGGVSSQWYLYNDPPVFFYNFVSCHAAQYKAMDSDGNPYDTPNYLAGAAIFGNKTCGLLAIGGTRTSGMISVQEFFGPLSEGKCIGEAFKGWFTWWMNRPHTVSLYGTTIIGDPTLRLRSPVTSVTHALPYNATAIYPRWSVNVTAVVKNLGTITKTFNVILYASADNITYAIGTQTIANLTQGAEETLTFTWDNTTDIAWPYMYTISAEARINATRNTGFDSTPLEVRIPGDANNDGKVNLYDTTFVSARYGSAWPDPNYDWQADMNGDGEISLYDIVIVATNYGYGT